MGEDEFKELYARLSTVIFSYAARALSPEQAKDVVSETFAAVWRKRDDLPLNRDERSRWVIGVGKKQVLQEQQRVRRKHHDNRFIYEHAKESTKNAAPDIADAVAGSLQARWVWQQLKPAEQELVNLAFVRGLADTAAAGILGLTVTAYTTRVSRARRHIAALLESSDSSVPDIHVSRGES